VIDEREVVQRLVAVCPEFAADWQAYVDSWEGLPSGEYNHVSALARWVVRRMAVRDLDCVTTLFEDVEGLLVNATAEMRNLIVIGLLEDIQNFSKYDRVDPDIALGLLGPESRKEWFFLIRSIQRDWPGQAREDG
jgi:hypothetical protein